MTTTKRLTYQQVLEIARRGLSYIKDGATNLGQAKDAARIALERLPYSGTRSVKNKSSEGR